MDKSKTLGASALIGRAGELAVAVELLRRHVHVASPAYDRGIDLLAYREADLSSELVPIVPIQVKARSGSCYQFRKSWFHIPGLVLVQVWHVEAKPEFYVFGSVAHVEEALGKHAKTAAWTKDGAYTAVHPAPTDIELMQHHRDQWGRIIGGAVKGRLRAATRSLPSATAPA